METPPAPLLAVGEERDSSAGLLFTWCRRPPAQIGPDEQQPRGVAGTEALPQTCRGPVPRDRLR